jgi:hypothetical protein
MKNVQMSAANKGVLSTARTDEGSKILTKSCAARLGFYAWNEPKIGDTRQPNPFILLV